MHLEFVSCGKKAYAVTDYIHMSKLNLLWDCSLTLRPSVMEAAVHTVKFSDSRSGCWNSNSHWE